jgi:hypothetical protein
VAWWSGSGRFRKPADVAHEFWKRHFKDWFADVAQPGWTQTENGHYGSGYRLDDWGASLYWDGRGDAAGTVFAEVRQETLAVLPPEGLPTLLDTFRTARLDLVCVDLERRVLPADLWDGISTATTRTHRARWRRDISNYGLNDTLYVGSRKSERSGRFYIKESNAGVRHELELKGDLAGKVAMEWVAGASLGALYAREHEALVSWPRVPGWVAWRASWAA